MPHAEPTDQIRSTAALYSLGALPPEEAHEFEHHVEECAVCRAELRAFANTAAAIPETVPELQPPPNLRGRVLAATKVTAPGVKIVRANEGRWRPTPFPGVSVKILHIDKATQMATTLMRMEPGASYPPHRHKQPEQCLVLEGDVRQAETVLNQGDYNLNDADSTHGRLSTENGCLLLLISSLQDEMLS